MNKYINRAAFVFVVFCQSVHADIVVRFVESAPKDRFVIENTGQCKFTNLVVQIDLSASAGRLIFDTTASGAGVEVFQPFEVREGEVRLLSSSQVEDGDQKLSVGVQTLAPDTSVSFTIDVDDTLPVSELGKIRVSGSEIENGKVNVSYDEQPVSSGRFNADSIALVSLAKC